MALTLIRPCKGANSAPKTARTAAIKSIPMFLLLGMKNVPDAHKLHNMISTREGAALTATQQPFLILIEWNAKTANLTITRMQQKIVASFARTIVHPVNLRPTNGSSSVELAKLQIM